tara:strand:+ start:250 stop:1029 length:780 start_codon:yes stop_codon:yes gene_type:complete
MEYPVVHNFGFVITKIDPSVQYTVRVFHNNTICAEVELVDVNTFVETPADQTNSFEFKIISGPINATQTVWVSQITTKSFIANSQHTVSAVCKLGEEFTHNGITYPPNPNKLRFVCDYKDYLIDEDGVFKISIDIQDHEFLPSTSSQKMLKVKVDSKDCYLFRSNIFSIPDHVQGYGVMIPRQTKRHSGRQVNTSDRLAREFEQSRLKILPKIDIDRPFLFIKKVKSIWDYHFFIHDSIYFSYMSSLAVRLNMLEILKK